MSVHAGTAYQTSVLVSPSGIVETGVEQLRSTCADCPVSQCGDSAVPVIDIPSKPGDIGRQTMALSALYIDACCVVVLPGQLCLVEHHHIPQTVRRRLQCRAVADRVDCRAEHAAEHHDPCNANHDQPLSDLVLADGDRDMTRDQSMVKRIPAGSTLTWSSG